MNQRPLPTDKTASDDFDGRSTEALKEHYLGCLDALSTKAPSLRSIVQTLLTRDVHWTELVKLATADGHNDKYIRKLLSEILTDLGIRRREPGAGRETPQQALLLLAYARSKYGDDAAKFLRAAHRVALAEADEGKPLMADSQIRALRFMTGI